MHHWMVDLYLLMLVEIAVMSSLDSRTDSHWGLESLYLRICLRSSKIFKPLTAILRESNMTFSALNQSKVCARAYYFKHIMHDWSDDNCRVILNHTIAAMERGYSKILIEDYIVPDQNAGVKETLIDMVVMVWCPGIERTRQQWTDLLQSVGLTIGNFWLRDEHNKGIIEAELQ
ncbi:unnamed protein product [Penicillium salamii]|nr:unnamed protein product [Penicillium salamii]